MEDSKDRAEEIVRDYLLNRVCIAAWFKHLQAKHPEVNSSFALKPLHGEDYNYFLNQQSDSLDSVFRDLILPIVQAGGCVPIFVVKELMRHTDGFVTKDSKISKRLNELASQYKLDIASERTQTVITSGPSVNTRYQCTVVRPLNPKQWTDHTFDWTQVSSVAYTGPVSAGQDLIKENELVYGVVGDVDDDVFTASAFQNDDGDDLDDAPVSVWGH